MMKRLLFLLMAVFLGFSLKAQINTFPYSESWETAGSFGSWTNVTTDSEDWVNQTGSTSSSSTGPDSASAGSRYLYVETSGASAGDQAFLENTFDISALTDPEIKFDYHMYFGGSVDGGRLAVDVSTDNGSSWCNVWALKGDQGQMWHLDETVSLKGYGFDTIMVRFNFIVGTNTSFQNDAAIDAFEMRSAVSAPTCPKPICVQAYNIASSSATIGWEPVSVAANGFDVIYGTAGFNPSTGGTNTNVTPDTIGLTGLSGATTYDVYVVSKCGGTNGSSDTAGPVSFTTVCVPFTAPYTQNFDLATAGGMPICWTPVKVGSSTNSADVEAYQFSTPRSTPNHLRLYNYFNNDTIMAIGPEFSDLTAGDKWVKFWAKSATFYVSDLYVGTVSSPTNAGGFTVLDTIPVANLGTYQQFIVNLDSANGYNGTDKYIAFMHDNSDNFDAIYVDDITYEQIPTCPDPRQATFSGITDTSAVVNFVSSNASTFEFNWGPCGFTQGSPTSTFKNGAKPFTIDSNLLPNTCYDLYIKSDCGAADGKSGWAGPFSFRTDCSTLSAPYSLSFDNLTAGSEVLDPCWDRYLVGGSPQFSDFENYAFGSPRSTPNHLRIYNYNNDTTLGITPAFSDLTSADKRIRFWAKAGSSFNATNSDLWIGTVADRGRIGATLTIIDTVPVGTNTTYTEHIINIDSANGYNGVDQTIAIMHSNGGTFDIIYVDDFVYETIPSCTGPLAAQSGLSAVGASTAGVFWNGGIGDTTKIVWGTVGFDPATGRIGRGFADGADTTFTITGLSPQTSYDFYIQDSCNNAGAGVYVGPFTFTTACLPVLAPFTEDFDDNTVWSGSTVDPCWSSNGPGGFAHQWGANSGTTGSSNTGPSGDNTSGTGQYLYTETSSSSPTLAILTTPLFDVSNLNVPFMSFFYHRYGSDMGTLKVQINDGSGWQTIVTLVGQDQTASGDPWKESGVDVSAYGDTIQFRFESTRGSSFRGDGAIDDFSVKEAPACPKVANLGTSSLVDTSAVLSWGGTSSATNYQVWFGSSGFYQGTQTTGGFKTLTGSAAQDSLLVDTLTPNTCYQFLVRGICQPGDTSEWVGPVTICTPCSPFNAPYTISFDALSAGNLDACWSNRFIGGSGSSGVFENYSFGTPRSSPNHIRFYNYNHDTSMGITPAFSDMSAGDKRIKFWVKAGSSFNTSNLRVGTMSDPNRNSTITIFDTVVVGGNNAYSQAIVNLTTTNGYNGSDQNIVILHSKGVSPNSFETIYIDDFSYELIPACPEPLSASVLSTDSSSARVTWDDPNGAPNYQIEVGTGSLGSSSNTQLVVNNDTATIPNLMDGTVYNYWVRSLCTGSDTSFWTGPVSFKTECKSKTAPYLQDFDSQTARETPTCWTPYIIGANAGSADFETYAFASPNSNPNHLRIYNYFNLDTIAGYSPRFRDLDAGDKRIRFYVKAGSTFNSVNTDLFIGTMGDPNRPGATMSIFDTVQVGTNTTYSEVTVNLDSANGYNGSDEYIVIMHSNDAVGTFDIIYVDDFNYEKIPTCVRPSNLASSSISQDSATISWTANGTGANFQVEYGSAALGNAANTRLTVSNDTLNLKSLNAGTPYCFWVREICAPGDTSLWQGPECFKTLCPVSFPAPYFTDFENIAEGSFSTFDNCWTTSATSGVPRWIAEKSTGSNQNSFATGPIYDHTNFNTPGGTYMFTENSGASLGASVDLEGPTVDISSINNVEVSFWYFMHGATVNKLEVRVDTGSGFYTIDTIVGQQQASQTDLWLESSNIVFTGANTIKVAIRHFAGSSFTSDIAIDDVSVREAASCLKATNIKASPLSATSSQVSWDTTGLGGASYIVEEGAVGFTTGTGTLTNVSGSTHTVTGLNAVNLCREVYLYTVCSSGDTSLPAGPIKVCPSTTLCTDSLDQYSTGNAIFGESTLFIPWAGAEGDAEISTTQAASGTQSLYLTDTRTDGFSDVVALFDTISSGAWEVAFKYYVPSGDGAYFNIQQNYIGGATGNLWNAEVYFQGNGTAEVQYDGGNNIAGTFSYTQGQWENISTIIDLDNDTIWFELNGSSTNVGYTYSAANLGQSVQFNGVNFFTGVLGTANYDANFYMDDFCVSAYTAGPAPICNMPTGLAATANVGCDSIEVDWTSNTGSSIIQWGAQGFTPGTGNFTGIVASPFTATGLTPNTAYDFWVADTCGSDTSMFAGPITVTTANAPQPVANISVLGDTILGGQKQFFLDASNSADASSYLWNFGNGLTSSQVSDTATYAVSGSFTVSLIVTNACGSDTATVNVISDIGLDENILSRSLNIYPNPTSEMVNIEFDAAQSGDASIRITDMRGRVVLKRVDDHINGRYTEAIDVSNLANGVYMVEIQSGELRAVRRLNIR